MGHDSTLYEPPKSDVQTNREKYLEILPAGNWKRFFNYSIDYIAVYVFAIIFGVAVVLLFGDSGLQRLENINPIEELALGFLIYASYYVLFEYFTGKTIGKLITGTKVVNEEGAKPTINQILGRSLCRLIPFEPFSFFGASGRGWHDKIPRTFVIDTRMK